MTDGRCPDWGYEFQDGSAAQHGEYRFHRWLFKSCPPRRLNPTDLHNLGVPHGKASQESNAMVAKSTSNCELSAPSLVTYKARYAKMLRKEDPADFTHLTGPTTTMKE